MVRQSMTVVLEELVVRELVVRQWMTVLGFGDGMVMKETAEARCKFDNHIHHDRC